MNIGASQRKLKDSIKDHEEILNDHTEKIERLLRSLAALEGRPIPEPTV